MGAAHALRLHRLLLRIAFSASNAFAWIFIFGFFYGLSGGDVAMGLLHAVYLYALSQTTAILLTPFAARALRDGMRREMLIGALSASAALVLLGASFTSVLGPYALFAMVGVALLLGMYRALYWVPYEVERNDIHTAPAKLSFEILVALMPAFVGSIFAYHGVYESRVLFGIAAVMLLALIPLGWIPDLYEGFPWGYLETFGQLLERPHRRLIAGAIIDGVQGAALILIWPLAIFLVLGWSVLFVGLILSFTMLMLIVSSGILRRYPRRLRIFESLPVRIAIVSSAWVGRMFIFNPVSIVAADAYLHAGDPKISADRSTMEQSADAGHFIDEYTVVREMGLLLGRIVFCILFIVAVSLLPVAAAFAVAFIAAGIAAGFSVLLSTTARQTI